MWVAIGRAELLIFVWGSKTLFCIICDQKDTIQEIKHSAFTRQNTTTYLSASIVYQLLWLWFSHKTQNWFDSGGIVVFKIGFMFWCLLRWYVVSNKYFILPLPKYGTYIYFRIKNFYVQFLFEDKLMQKNDKVSKGDLKNK